MRPAGQGIRLGVAAGVVSGVAALGVVPGGATPVPVVLARGHVDALDIAFEDGERGSDVRAALGAGRLRASAGGVGAAVGLAGVPSGCATPRPGQFALYTVNSFGTSTVLLDSADGLPDAFDVARGAHGHGNWAFRAAGTYTLTFEVTATTTRGAARTSGQVANQFVVGS